MGLHYLLERSKCKRIAGAVANEYFSFSRKHPISRALRPLSLPPQVLCLIFAYFGFYLLHFFASQINSVNYFYVVLESEAFTAPLCIQKAAKKASPVAPCEAHAEARRTNRSRATSGDIHRIALAGAR